MSNTCISFKQDSNEELSNAVLVMQGLLRFILQKLIIEMSTVFLGNIKSLRGSILAV